MIILNNDTRSLEIVLAGAVSSTQLTYTLNYTNQTPNFLNTENSTNGTTNNVTAVTMLSAPMPGGRKLMRSLFVYNADNATSTVTVRLNDNSTTRIIVKVILAIGDHLIYTSESGWFILDTNGQIKTLVSSTAATQAEQETASNTSVYVSPGRQQFHPSASKGWFRCDMAGTLNRGYNVSSITDTAQGVATVNWTVSFSDASYAPTGNAIINTGGTAATTYTVFIENTIAQGSVRYNCCRVSDGALTDPNFLAGNAMGDL